jgi:hypothetical protein
MKRALILSVALLGGCNSTPGTSLFPTSYNAPATSAAPAKCPADIASLPAYSQAMQRQVAREMRAAGGAAWPRMVSDWIYARQTIRHECK